MKLNRSSKRITLTPETDADRGAMLDGNGVYLHHSRVPLSNADLNQPDGRVAKQCGLGMCFL